MKKKETRETNNQPGITNQAGCFPNPKTWATKETANTIRLQQKKQNTQKLMVALANFFEGNPLKTRKPIQANMKKVAADTKSIIPTVKIDCLSTKAGFNKKIPALMKQAKQEKKARNKRAVGFMSLNRKGIKLMLLKVVGGAANLGVSRFRTPSGPGF